MHEKQIAIPCYAGTGAKEARDDERDCDGALKAHQSHYAFFCVVLPVLPYEQNRVDENS